MRVSSIGGNVNGFRAVRLVTGGIGPGWLRLFTFLLAAVAMSPAFAGDRAMIDFIGYSHDRRYFAFEEYGVSDGIGVAYSNIYIVDLINDEFAAGSPFQAEADEGIQQPLSEIRARTREAAKKVLTDLQVDIPVEIDMLSGDGVIGPANKFHFGLPAYGEPGATQGEYTLFLKSYKLPMSDVCAAKIDRPGEGFALTIAGDGPVRELHRDGDLPDWRGCPVGYRLYAVVRPLDFGLADGVVIVSTYPFDFEGPSRRFVAVPIGYPAD